MAFLVAAIVLAATVCFWAAKSPTSDEINQASRTAGYVQISGPLERPTISATGR